MTLSFEDQFKFRFVPGSLYYRHKIRSEISSGEPELAVLGRLFTGGDGTVIDVGANRGFYSYALSKLFANVFAFEPNPDLAKFARKKLPHNVEVYEYALGATNEVAQFHIPIGKTGRRSHLLGGLSSRGETEMETFPVTVRTLDSFGMRDVRFIKIDVEGTESDVLLGAAKTIERDRPVLLLEMLAGYYEDPLEAIHTICRSFGYEACVMNRHGTLAALSETADENDKTSRNVIFATATQLKIWAAAGLYEFASG
jgi:FkbM family methyltransferase